MDVTADALAFDMDGTLVDSHAVIAAVWTEWAQRHGFDPAAVLDYCHGRPLHRIIAQFLPDGHTPGEAEWWLRRLPACEDQLRPIAGAPELLASLSPGDWALVTSAPADLARRWMGVCGLPLPRVVITADDVSRPKPDAQPFAMAAERLGHPPDRMIAFEDSPAGLTSARAAGMPSIGVGGASGSLGGIADYRALVLHARHPLRLTDAVR